MRGRKDEGKHHREGGNERKKREREKDSKNDEWILHKFH